MEMDKNTFALNMSYPEIQIMLLESSLIFSPQAYGLVHSGYMYFLIRGPELTLVLVGQEET